jgi:hypothetical protein
MDVMDAFGVRVRIGMELVVAGCKALFRHWNLMICLPLRGAESFVFQVAIQKLKD